MNETLGIMPPRHRRRPLLRGRTGVSAPGPLTHNHRPRFPEDLKYPTRAALSALQRETLSLVEIRPRTSSEVADALAIEWPTAEHTLSQLAKRLHVVRVAGRPTIWRLRSDEPSVGTHTGQTSRGKPSRPRRNLVSHDSKAEAAQRSAGRG